MSTAQRKPQRAPKKTQPADTTESDSAKTTTKQPKAPRKKTSSSKKKSESKGNAPKDSIKVVVRLLPADLQENSFWDSVKEFVKPETCHAKYFVQGHYSTKPFKTPIYSRAYIQFKKVSLADAFVEKFKAMPFEDDKESTLPQFTSCLYNRMPEDREEKSFSNHLPLQETPAFKLFLKYQDDEIEKPKTFLSSAKAAEKESKEAEKQVEEKKVEGKLVKEAADDKTKKKKRSKTEKKDGKKDKSSKDTKIDGKTGQKEDKKPKKKSKSIRDTKDKPPKDTKAQQKKDKPEEKATSDKLTGEKAKSKSKSRRKKEKEKEKDTKTPQNQPSNSSPSSNTPQTSNTQDKPKILIRKQDEDHKDQTSPKVIMKRRPVS